MGLRGDTAWHTWWHRHDVLVQITLPDTPGDIDMMCQYKWHCQIHLVTYTTCQYRWPSLRHLLTYIQCVSSTGDTEQSDKVLNCLQCLSQLFHQKLMLASSENLWVRHCCTVEDTRGCNNTLITELFLNVCVTDCLIVCMIETSPHYVYLDSSQHTCTQ